MLLRLREFRVERGLTQDKVAADLGLSVGQVSKLERGDSAISLDRLADFAALYRCEPADLIADAPLAARIAVAGTLASGAWLGASPSGSVSTIALPPLGPLAGRPRSAWRLADRTMNLVYPPGSILIAVALADVGRWLHDGERVIVRRQRADGRVEHTVLEYILRPPQPWLTARSDDPAQHRQIAIPYSLTEIARAPRDCLCFAADGLEVTLTHLVVASVRPEPTIG